ncbi:MAG: tetratricopeptide repeat protein [Anaerolineae bacterium]|nr:tetratricopeptide repeat protein [Anaerolineae bacterium]
MENNGSTNGNHATNNGSNRKRRPPKIIQPDMDFPELLEEGTKALERGQVSVAIKLLEQAHKMDPDHPDLLLNLGGAYILSKKFKQAVDILELLSDRQPSNPMVWTNLGAAYLGNPILATDEKQQRAIGAFKLAIALDPKAPNVAYNLGLIYRDRKENEEALHWFRRALKANPKDKDALYYINQLSNQNDDENDNAPESDQSE